jgi:hypothetical protein
MLEPASPSAPQPPIPWPWGKIATWLVVIGLVVAFAVVPSFRNNVIHVWTVSKTFFARLFGF